MKNAYLFAENDQKMTNFWFKKMSNLGISNLMMLKNGKIEFFVRLDLYLRRDESYYAQGNCIYSEKNFSNVV
jgi:hypothetical protein